MPSGADRSHIEILIEEAGWLAACPNLEGLAHETVAAVLAENTGEIAILFTSDVAMRELNRDFRRIDNATNVLSFPAAQGSGHRLGDIALAFETCREEARDQSKAFVNHVRHLLVHGLLHLLGYDHITDSEAELMEAREREILNRFGIADPYDAVRFDDGKNVAH